ncbi:hypothetical protein SEA_OCTOBIEN14_116 [Gordonia phage Octobien14]|uniref:Uncharacterized protein n=1 Tax=Gordonia phage Octobien14 TaxID=2483673 RepID=A0A3G3MA26_9CAUD|nr:hypothetical protein L3Y22_gp128 [Gordonia phage Octobien14]AYR03253.1 hypothetical protein SEA_OCTOBIEN14_116 [Gordonia phage Octobien14]
MRFTIRLFGRELLSFSFSETDASEEVASLVSDTTPSFGFVYSDMEDNGKAL